MLLLRYISKFLTLPVPCGAALKTRATAPVIDAFVDQVEAG